MERKVEVRELIKSLKESYHVLGSLDSYVLAPATIDQADEDSLSFCSRKKEQVLQIIRGSRARVIVCPEGIEPYEQDYQNKTLILVPNPRLTFARLIRKYFVPAIEFGIHPSAVVDQKAEIHPKVYIGPNCSIGNCQIDEGTVLYGNVSVYPETELGKRVKVHAGTVVGSEGFGYERNEKGELESFPQLGGVRIEDDVEIGANVSIDRGTLGDTVIGVGSRIDNLTHISHNDIIGKHCQINALVVVAGSVTIGDYSHIAPHACLREGLNIGHHVLVGMGSVVTKDISDNLVVMGSPAKPIRKNISKG
ncbi:LpxD N-terminal domain-containing protein [Chloroflexota bacterium]